MLYITRRGGLYISGEFESKKNLERKKKKKEQQQ
jgi:hypothetical protein